MKQVYPPPVFIEVPVPNHLSYLYMCGRGVGILLFLRYLLFDSVVYFCFTFYHILHKVRFRFMVFNATFNNIAVISLPSVLLVKETGLPGENRRPVASH